MPTSIVALEILLILLPGFATAYIVQLLALRGKQTDFDKAIEAALYQPGRQLVVSEVEDHGANGSPVDLERHLSA
jgi:hypothetical protein